MDKRMSIPTRYDLESKIYANFKALEEVQAKLDSGNFSFSTYRKLIQVKIRDLLFIDAILKTKGLDLETVTKEMKISNKFVDLIPKIQDNLEKSISLEKKIDNPIVFDESDIQSNTQAIRTKKSKFNELAEISNLPSSVKDLIPLSSKITSDFITIIDFLKLKLDDIEILRELIENLLKSLEKFPKMEELLIDIKLDYKNRLEGTINGDQLYRKFEEYYLRFKSTLFT